MRLSANSFCYRELDRKQVFESMARIGLYGVEIITHKPCFHVDILDTKKVREETLAYLEKIGLKIVALSAGTEFIQFDKDARRNAVEHCFAQIDLTELYGVDTLRIFAGGNIPQEKTLEECIDVVVEGMKPCIEYAEKKGIRLAVENHGVFGAKLEAMLAVFDRIKSPILGLTLDTASYAYYKVDLINAIEKLGSKIFHTHLKDFILVNGEYNVKPVGEGDLDFPSILKKLIEVDYKGEYCIEYGRGEYTPEESLKRSMKYLNKLGDKLGL